MNGLSTGEDNFAEDAENGFGIHVVAKPIGPLCNLNCECCFYIEKQALFAPGEKYRMSRSYAFKSRAQKKGEDP